MQRASIAAALLATSTSLTLVAQSRYLPTSPGTWKPWRFIAESDSRRVLGARPADLKELEAQLLGLNAIIKKTEGMTNPIGFSVETVGELDLGGRFSPRAGEPALAARPLPAVLNFGAYPVTEFGRGAAARSDDTGETAQLLFFVNQLSQPLFSIETNVPEFEKLDADVARLAPEQPDVLGFPRYGDTIVIKRSGAPIWSAVTFADALDLVARSIDVRLTDERGAVARVQQAYDDMKDPKKREARMAQYRKLAPQVKDPAYLEKMTKTEADMESRADKEFLPQLAVVKAAVTKSEEDLAGVKTTLARLSAADKAAPACYASSDKVSVSRFRRGPAAGCEPLVRPNWTLFNPALPRSTPQLLTIANFDQCLVQDRQVLHVGGCTANMRLLRSIDKAALLAWLQ